MRDFRSEISAAAGDAQKLRTLAAEAAAAGANGALRLMALNMARQADAVPHPLGRLATELNLPKPDGRPLYLVKLDDTARRRIETELRAGLHNSTSRTVLAPLFVLWAADWFRRSYRGGTLRWEDLGQPLEIELPQKAWRDLTDSGLQAWKIPPVRTDYATLRLVAIARQSGFPVAAIAEGGGWAKTYLERIVGELLGAGTRDVDMAHEIAKRAEHLIPGSWRSPEMCAVSGELALRVAELRAFAERRRGTYGLPLSAVLDRDRPGWREELPLTSEGIAGPLIDTLLSAKPIAAGGAVRVYRYAAFRRDRWEERVRLMLDGTFQDRSERRLHEEHQRLYLHAAGALADQIPGHLAFLEHQTGNEWRMRGVRRESSAALPFDRPVEGELHGQGQRVTPPFPLPGGRAVGSSLRVFADPDDHLPEEERELVLLAEGSGAFRQERLYIGVPEDWRLFGTDDKAEIAEEHLSLEVGRRLYRCSGNIFIDTGAGDRFLVRTGQNAEIKDRLAVFGDTPPGVTSDSGQPVYLQTIQAEIREGAQRRYTTNNEVCWRFADERTWRSNIRAAGPGDCEFGWLDPRSGHLRAKDRALVLPRNFVLQQERRGSHVRLDLHGWVGEAEIDGAERVAEHCWRLRVDPPKQAYARLRLSGEKGGAFTLRIPLKTREWIGRWDSSLYERESLIALSALNDAVARTPARCLLMADLPGRRDRSLHAKWWIEDELGLSALREELAALIRPNGLDTKVRLNFHNGSEDNWYVTEFDNKLERQPTGGLSPKYGIVSDTARICGRYLGAPEREKDFGPFAEGGEVRGARPIGLPRLKGDWLIYLRDGGRILTRPLYLSGDAGALTPQHPLGRAMIRSREDIDQALDALCEMVAADLLAEEAEKTLNALTELALSLGGLPPQTFQIFLRLKTVPVLGPLMLFRCEAADIDMLLRLVDGLPFSWTTLPKAAWEQARAAQGRMLMNMLDDAHWVVEQVSARETEIVDRAPELEPLVRRDFRSEPWDKVRHAFIDRGSDGIDHDLPNPFRPGLAELLRPLGLGDHVLRVLDAPLAAALSAKQRAHLDDIQMMVVKEVERRHPRYFREAYAAAIHENWGEDGPY